MNIHPRTLLQLDAFGAGLTALTTFFLLAGERINTGLPSESLVAMSVVAASFLCFDIVALCWPFDARIALRVIACANLLYCVLAVTLMVMHRDSATSLGLAYFGIELPIVVLIAVFEWTVATQKSTP